LPSFVTTHDRCRLHVCDEAAVHNYGNRLRQVRLNLGVKRQPSVAGVCPCLPYTRGHSASGWLMVQPRACSPCRRSGLAPMLQDVALAERVCCMGCRRCWAWASSSLYRQRAGGRLGLVALPRHVLAHWVSARPCWAWPHWQTRRSLPPQLRPACCGPPLAGAATGRFPWPWCSQTRLHWRLWTLRRKSTQQSARTGCVQLATNRTTTLQQVCDTSNVLPCSCHIHGPDAACDACIASRARVTPCATTWAECSNAAGFTSFEAGMVHEPLGGTVASLSSVSRASISRRRAGQQREETRTGSTFNARLSTTAHRAATWRTHTDARDSETYNRGNRYGQRQAHDDTTRPRQR